MVHDSDDDNVQLRRSWHEWEVDGRERRVILVVETGLEMRPGHEGFDAAALDKLADVYAIFLGGVGVGDTPVALPE